MEGRGGKKKPMTRGVQGSSSALAMPNRFVMWAKQNTHSNPPPPSHREPKKRPRHIPGFFLCHGMWPEMTKHKYHHRLAGVGGGDQGGEYGLHHPHPKRGKGLKRGLERPSPLCATLSCPT